MGRAMEVNGNVTGRPRAAILAWQRIQEKGIKHRNRKNGNTLLHEALEASTTTVFICAKAGAHINAQNFDGDTALHLAVRANNRSIARALLMCGADISMRNKLGQSSLDEARGPMHDLLHLFRPGLVTAVTKAEPAAIQRLTKLWINPHAKIKDGQSALELLEPRIKSEEGACKCNRYLQDNMATLELVHAVLAEDCETVSEILGSKRNWNTNVRFRDKRGMTPLYCAVEQDHLELCQLLVEKGNSNVNARVRETENEDHTIPIYFKSLDCLNSEEVWRFLSKHIDGYQDSERDSKGDAAIFRAISNNKPETFISAMIQHRQGLNVLERNADNETPRQYAEKLGKQDIVDAIDKYIFENCCRGFLVNLPLNFYGKHMIKMPNKEGKTLKELAQEGGNEQDIQATEHYSTIERQAKKLFEAAKTGNIQRAAKLNTATYKDKNGYTAVTKAVVYNQPRVVEMLIAERPNLRLVPDNCNRYPLHYAYLMPEPEGSVLRRVLLQLNPEEIEHRVDKDGRTPVEYSNYRDSPKAESLLENVRSLDLYGRERETTFTTIASSSTITPYIPPQSKDGDAQEEI